MLLLNGIDDFLAGDAVGGHHVRLDPYTHTVGVAKEVDATHARDTADTRYHVDVQIVDDKRLVESVVGALQRLDLQDGVDALLHGDALLGHFGRQLALGLTDTVLHVDGGFIGIGALLEIHVDFSAAIGEGRRRDVHHVFHAVHLLFDRHDDRFHDRGNIGTRVAGRDNHLRRRNVGVLLNRQRVETHHTDQANQHADDKRRHPVLYEIFFFPYFFHTFKFSDLIHGLVLTLDCFVVPPRKSQIRRSQ